MEHAAGEDLSFLSLYAQQRDEQAFAALVRRHVDLVYSSALRRVGDRQLAEDVTQAVFVILAKKAGSIRTGPLSAWLLSTVRYAAANALRIENRRRRHERAAALAAGETWGASAARGAAGACSPTPADVLVWQEVARQLDDAVLALPSADRRAVLLRYFEDRGIPEIAADLKVSEGAAKQRLGRAVQKLRERLSRRGVSLAGEADATSLAALLASHAVRTAPPGLVNAACAAATGGAAAAGAGISIAKGAMTMMAWAKTKLVASVVVGLAVIGGTGGAIAVRAAMADEKGGARAARPAAADPDSATPAAAAQEAPAEPTDADAAKPDDDRVSVRTAPPVVVATVPQSGKTGLDAKAVKELRVTYSKAMTDGSWSWSTWGQENFPKTTGKPHYLPDKRTCVLPVELEPGHTYAIWLNSNNFGNFKDSTGRKAVPYLLIFETKK
jgi:RNA polymerase sigma factor (sigma-70 family)